MIVRVSTNLNTPTDKAWGAVKRPATLVRVARGMLGFAGSDSFPEEWREGHALKTRLLFFHLIPSWRHNLRVVKIDEEKREIVSNESGGPVRRWNHLIRVEPTRDGRSRYTDEIDIDAGLLTPFVWGFASVFYRYRQMRWRRLAVSLQ